MAAAKDSSKPEAVNVVSLIREGWDHLRLQSPLAAWGSWQEAIRIDPESKAAKEALATLESAGELPAAARALYRFRNPENPERRSRWDERLRGTTSEALSDAANVFSTLTELDPDDAEAWYNRALCLAWIGQNREAVSCLDRFVTLRANTAFETAVSAWILGEVLRQGRGAESLADDLRFSLVIRWEAEDTLRLKKHLEGLRQIPTPNVPTSEAISAPAVSIYEWLGDSISSRADEASGRLLLATLYESGGSLRLSSPRADTLETALEHLALIVDLESRDLRREAGPLPLSFLDAAVWTLRLPAGLDQEVADRLTRDHVENYFEDHWIHVARNGLDGHSPSKASILAANGDRVLKAKLTAVIRFREQLGTRPGVGPLYKGYPFDRLRTRLGIEPADGNAFESDDLASASASTLGQLEPSTLADARLVAAFESANGLRNDDLAEKFASALVTRGPDCLRGVDIPSLASCLVRVHLAREQSAQALTLLESLAPLVGEPDRRKFTTWRAEIMARDGRGEEAALLYRGLLESDPNPAVIALDAAETLIDNGELLEAPQFLEDALQMARAVGLEGVEKRSELLLESF